MMFYLRPTQIHLIFSELFNCLCRRMLILISNIPDSSGHCEAGSRIVTFEWTVTICLATMNNFMCENGRN